MTLVYQMDDIGVSNGAHYVDLCHTEPARRVFWFSISYARFKSS